MCRSTEYHHSLTADRLKIKAFFVRFTHLKSLNPPPESLTLFYLPRIHETTVLEVDGAKIRPDLPAFLTLHRVVSASPTKDALVFGSRERVRASEGVQFQVYLRDEKVVQGIFRRSDDGEWRLECKSALDSEIAGAEEPAPAAEICVDVEGQVAMFEKVALEVRRKKRRSFCGLEEIPEGRELDADCIDCSCGHDGDSSEEEEEEDDDDNNGAKEVEMVRWAVDLGIWAVCLGVGYLVSRAAQSKTLRRKRLI